MTDREYQAYFRTRKSWMYMRDRFFKEWSEGCETIRNQFRYLKNERTYVSSAQVNDWFTAHGERMRLERWPEIRKRVKK